MPCSAERCGTTCCGCRLPYFAHRPTGVIAARLHGVETIREFLASAAVTLILDLPFLLIFIGIMFWYSVTLTLVVLAIIAVIVTLSALVAPIFQRRLNEQFLRGARHQAFVTEYVAGMETVKSLQLEPQLNDRYSTLLAAYLESGLRTKQLANTYNTAAGTLEQGMTLLILALGAWIVMTTDMTTSGAFTIGMLVAFQMFAQRVSQPMLRLVGLWQQFQQARLSVERLGDLMNAPSEPYTEQLRRELSARSGDVQVEQLAFRYAEDLPLLYERLSFRIPPGTVTALMGPSGCGKSTLAKLLQGFYLPTHGAIRLDGVDARHLSANELRSYFGVVPQETILFSGTLRDNLLLAHPTASFEEMVAACKVAQIHEVIERLPKGYDTELGERGTGLSGGQKQRLAIARALLKHPKILIFDEAIANLDANTAEEFIRTVNTLHGHVTILFITHALPRSLQVDQLVRLGTKPEVLTAVPPGREQAKSRSITDPVEPPPLGEFKLSSATEAAEPGSNSTPSRLGNALDFIERLPPARAPRIVLWAVCGLFAFMLVWSLVAQLDIVAVAEGRLVPSHVLQDRSAFGKRRRARDPRQGRRRRDRRPGARAARPDDRGRRQQEPRRRNRDASHHPCDASTPSLPAGRLT